MLMKGVQRGAEMNIRPFSNIIAITRPTLREKPAYASAIVTIFEA